MRAVEMPTSAPNPKRNPSAKRELALWNTHALSTCFWKCFADHSISKARINNKIQQLLENILFPIDKITVFPYHFL